MKKNETYTIGLLDVFQCIFLTLKCCNLISWSWWQVLIPFWISLVITIITVGMVLWNHRERSK